MELSRRAAKAAAYREELLDSNKALKKLESEKKTWLKQMADLRSQMSRKEKQAEEEIQSLSRELKEREHRGLLAGMEGCREQIMLTPVGQQFLHVLKEELIKDFCRSPHLIDTLGDAITSLLEAGRKFAMAKLSAEDLNPDEDLQELVMQAPDLNKIIGIDEGLSWESPWWTESFRKAFEVFVRGSFSDPSYPAWGVLPFPLASCPDEMLPFDEIDKRMIEMGTDFSPERTPDPITLPITSGPSLADPEVHEGVAGHPGGSSPSLEASQGNVEEQENPGVSSLASAEQISTPTI